MRAGLAVLLVAACANPPSGESPPRESGPRTITIGADAIAAAHAAVDLEVLGGNDEMAVATIDASQLDTLSEQMHDRFHRCGGFMVEDPTADVPSLYSTSRDEALDGIDYTLDRATIVNAV